MAKPSQKQEEVQMTYSEAEKILGNTTKIREAGKSKQQHAKASAEIQQFCSNMARGMRLLLSRNSKGNFDDTRRAKVKAAFQPFFDDLYSEKLTEAQKEESRAIIAVLRRALRTATDLKAFKAGLWNETHSIVCNTVGSAEKKAQLTQKLHETAEQKAARIAKEEAEKESAKAKRVFNAAITFDEAILHWKLDDLANIEAQLEAKFDFEERKIEWEIQNGKVVQKKQKQSA